MTRDQLLLCATLTKLQLAENDLAILQHQLSVTCELFETIRHVDTRGVKPMVHPLDITLTGQHDIVDTCSALAAFDWKKIAPSFEDNYFKVPKIID